MPAISYMQVLKIIKKIKERIEKTKERIKKIKAEN